MARLPVGTVPQALSRTALFAYIAARLHGSPPPDHDHFFRDEIRVLVGRNGAEEAARPHRYVSPRKRPRGGTRPTSVRREPAIRDWLAVDEQRLGLETVLIRFPGDGRKQSELLAMLFALPGIRQVIETAPRREVVAIAVVSGADGRRVLRSQLEEVADRLLWEEILAESYEPALQTWIELTREAAAAERLLVRET